MNKLMLSRSIFKRSQLLVSSQCRQFSSDTYKPDSKFKGVTLDNPYTGEVIEKVPFLNSDEQKLILKKCWESYRQFRYQPLDERKKIVANIATYFRQNREQVAIDITRMMGKPIT